MTQEHESEAADPVDGIELDDMIPEEPDTPDNGIADEDRVPIDEIQDQTNVILTSFFDTANSMETWYPPLEELDVPLPKTQLISLEGGSEAYLGMSRGEVAPLLMADDADRKMEFIGRPEYSIEDLQGMIEDEFNSNVFVRSNYKSARHLDDVAGQITDPSIQNIKNTIALLFDDHIMQSMPIGGGIAFREFLDLDFLPDGDRTFHPEVRFFVDDGDVKYHWPRMHKDSFKKATGDLSFYNEQVAYIEDNIDTLREYAARVADRFEPHAWSVDFVMTTDEEWYLTDMAVDAMYWNEAKGKWNNMSEHEPGSEHNLEETVGQELPAPASPPSGFPAWRNPVIE